MLIVELLEDVGLELAIVLADRLDDLLALAPRSGLHEICDLGGMQLGELRVGNAKTHGRHVSHERLDACPVQELAGTDALSERLWQQSAQAAARARVNAHDPPRAADERQLDLVRADQPGTLDVDQLPIEEIALEQHLLGPALEAAEIELGRAQDDACPGDVGDRLRG